MKTDTPVTIRRSDYAPPAFLVGYGLDHAENYRHLPFIADLE